jgi:uncharacterized protein
MFFHVVLTTECNLHCKYCFGESLEDFDEDFSGIDVDYSMPKKANYDFSLLAKICKRDPDCVLTFYGGEPLLCMKEIRQIMDVAKPRHFMIQTNGLLLDKLEPEYVNRFHAILVSLDGNEELTNYYRGKGTFRKGESDSSERLPRRTDRENDGDGTDRHLQASQVVLG